MGHLPGQTARIRTILATGVAVLAICICAARGHVHIRFSDPTTYASLFQHCCGLLLVACVAWAVVELAWHLRPPRRQSLAQG